MFIFCYNLQIFLLYYSLYNKMVSYPNLFTWFCVLGIIITCIVLICRQYIEVKSSYHPVIQNLKKMIVTCFPELRNLKIYEGCKSYTINKEKIYLCIRDRYGDFYEHSILMHVLLHEIAHTLCNEVGHTLQFKQIFDSLINRAIQCGIYTPVHIPKDYCNFE